MPKKKPSATANIASQGLFERLSTEARLELPFLDYPSLSRIYGPVIPGAPVEAEFSDEKRAQIQGNIVPGFNKPYQHFLFYNLGHVNHARSFLRQLLPDVTTMDQVLAFVRGYRSRRAETGRRDVGAYATWMNLAFSSAGLRKLMDPAAVDELNAESFHQGLAERSEYLGDPSSPSHPGHKSRWRVGGPHNPADLMIIVASDLEANLVAKVRQIQTEATGAGLSLVFEQRGDVLPGALRGHEHFGFRDGISQPAMRGRASSHPQDFIVPRYMAPGDPKAKFMAKPGQPLVWPGQFLLGEPRQAPGDLLGSVAAASQPAWARLGSFVVVRRLRQDVPAFWRFVASASRQVGLPAERVAAMLVGRWRSGAPILRSPLADNPALGSDDFANNHFVFEGDSQPATLTSIPGYTGDSFPQATQDFLATVCPHFAHIRKMNTRDAATEMGPHTDMMLRLILRRGIPFGPHIFGVRKPKPTLKRAERGLMFLSYQSNIEEQFEFLQRRWANSTIQPNLGGHDPIIGQADRYGNRERQIDFPTPGGPVRLTLDSEWVTPTGGGYFFAPAIGTIAALAMPTLDLGRLRDLIPKPDVFWWLRDPMPGPPPFLPLAGPPKPEAPLSLPATALKAARGRTATKRQSAGKAVAKRTSAKRKRG